jgi:hypothetical protein
MYQLQNYTRREGERLLLLSTSSTSVKLIPVHENGGIAFSIGSIIMLLPILSESLNVVGIWQRFGDEDVADPGHDGGESKVPNELFGGGRSDRTGNVSNDSATEISSGGQVTLP